MHQDHKPAPKGKKTDGIKHTEEKKPKGMKLCSHCGAVYYSGHWHTAPAMAALMKKDKKPGDTNELCIECRWLASGRDPKLAPFGGEVTLDGFNGLDEKEEIINTARNAGTKSQQHDPLSHIISIDDRGDRVVIHTTQNQLAVAIGKAIDASHKGGKLTITFSEGDMPARVHWTHKF